MSIYQFYPGKFFGQQGPAGASKAGRSWQGYHNNHIRGLIWYARILIGIDRHWASIEGVLCTRTGVGNNLYQNRCPVVLLLQMYQNGTSNQIILLGIYCYHTLFTFCIKQNVHQCTHPMSYFQAENSFPLARKCV